MNEEQIITRLIVNALKNGDNAVRALMTYFDARGESISRREAKRMVARVQRAMGLEVFQEVKA